MATFITEDGNVYYENVPENKRALFPNEPGTQVYNQLQENKADIIIPGITNAARAVFNDGLALPVTDLKVTVTPMQEGSGTPSSENIRPFIGFDEISVYINEEYNGETPAAVTTELSDDIYGCVYDVLSGTITVYYGYIAEYDGEDLPGVWFSSMDEYAEGSTPTTGAEVVYVLDDPVIISVDPKEFSTLEGANCVWSDPGNVSISYRADTKTYIQNVAANVVKHTQYTATTSAYGTINITTGLDLGRSKYMLISAYPEDANATYYAIITATATSFYAVVRKISDNTVLASTEVKLNVAYITI